MNSDTELIDPSTLYFSGDFDAQVLEVLEAIRLSRNEIEELRPLLFHVHQAVNNLWPGSEVIPFGSIVTGLGIRTSDIDIWVKLPPKRSEEVKTNPSDYVKRFGWKLKLCNGIFQKVFCIYTAKVPIIKFYHLPTGKNCDVSFTSGLGVHNSQLIGHLLNLDPRVRPLAILIKYWSKVYKLTGTNLVPNYGLTLLVIFYLQMKNILPSLLSLQKTVKPHLIENWNVAYDGTIKREPTEETLYQLLGGFFQFYDSFNFEDETIAPFLGYPIRREMLRNKENVPRTYKLYRSVATGESFTPINVEGAMCVQDPIQHDRNCTQGVHSKLFQLFKHHLNVAASLFVLVPEEDYLRQLLTTPSTLPQVPRRSKKSKSKANRGVGKPPFKRPNPCYNKFYRNECKTLGQELKRVYENIKREGNVKSEFNELRNVRVKQENTTVVKSEIVVKEENS